MRVDFVFIMENGCTILQNVVRLIEYFWEKTIGVGMRKHKRYLFACVVVASLFLSGCGTQLHELTKEEEDLIVHSAAYYVAKHNIRQKDGVSAVVDPDLIALEEESESVENITESDTEMAEEVIGESEGTAGASNVVDDTTISLAKAVGHENDLTITYSGGRIAANYVEGEAYSIDAQSGKTFYIMQFTVANPTGSDVLLDNVTLNPAFKLISGEENVKAEVTFLATDFSTYLGTIPAGESVETVLLFEVSEAVAEQITAPTLQITVDNEIKTIKL